MSGYPTNTDDVIDSRQVIEAVEELEELEESGGLDVSTDEGHTLDVLRKLLADLRELAEDYGADTPEDGQTIVRDDAFEGHAKELVEECGYFGTNHGQKDGYGVDFTAWPYRCIDWEQVAEELKDDYNELDFDGVTYWVR